MTVITGEGRVSILYSKEASPVAPHRPVYLARPDATGEHPGVVIAHSDVNATPAIKNLARRLARYGYAVAVPEGTERELRAVSAAFESGWGGWVRPGGHAILGVERGASAAAAEASSGDRSLVLLDPDLATFDSTGDGALLVLAVVPVPTPDKVTERGSWVEYKGLAEGFWNDAADGYSMAAAEDAIDRIVGFLDAVLGGVFTT